MELTLIALTSRPLPLGPARDALAARLEASMARLAGEGGQLAPGHKADLQRFISKFDGAPPFFVLFFHSCSAVPSPAFPVHSLLGQATACARKGWQPCLTTLPAFLTPCRSLPSCPLLPDARVAPAGWMDGRGNVKEGTHFLLSTTPKAELLVEGARCMNPLFYTPSSSSFFCVVLMPIPVQPSLAAAPGPASPAFPFASLPASPHPLRTGPPPGRSHHARAAQGAQDEPHLRQHEPAGHRWA